MGTNQLYYFLEIELLEKKSFEICDENQDGGLSWAEVDICEVCILTKKILKTSKILKNFFLQETYGLFVNLDRLPDEEDFDYFDSDQNGILYFEEWATISH